MTTSDYVSLFYAIGSLCFLAGTIINWIAR